MKRMTEAFSISLLSQSKNSANSTQQRKLKEISEHWSQSNHRGHGHYAKKPDCNTMLNLKSTLISSTSMINENLSLPNLSAPNWVNVGIGLLLSVERVRKSPPRSSLMTTLLLIDIANFIESWILATDSAKSTKKTNTIQERLLNTDFTIPISVPVNPMEQAAFLLHNVLIPIIARPLSAIKSYVCSSCKFSMRVHFTANYIPINVVHNQLLLRNELTSYFSGSMSDSLCPKCSLTMIRRIELLDCKHTYSCLLFF